MTTTEGMATGSAPTQRYTRDFAYEQRWVIIHDNEAAEDYLRLTRQLFESGKLVRHDGSPVPTAFVGISRGGTPPLTYVTHALEGYGLHFMPPFTISSSSYSGMNQTNGIVLSGMQEVMGSLHAYKPEQVIVVDDVCDSGRTIHSTHSIPRNGLMRNAPNAMGNPLIVGGYMVYEFEMRAGTDRYNLKIPLTDDIKPLDPNVELLFAVLHWKRDANTTGVKPDFYVDDTIGKGEWIVYPWGAPADFRGHPDLLAKHYPEKYRTLFG